MYHAAIIKNYLIDYFVPFLPLERSHVKICIKNELENYNFLIKEADVDSIADKMAFEPEGINKFSTKGCKYISTLVQEFVYGRGYKQKNEF